MRNSIKKSAFVAVIVLALGAPVLAAPADQIRTRIAGYRDLGAAYKSVNDAMRGDPQVATIRQAAQRIGNSARAQYAWFPAGSGPRPGVKTAAKPAIWAKSQEFRSAQDAFARQAAAFQRAARTGNIAAIRAESRKLGGTCKACHDTFRVPSD